MARKIGFKLSDEAQSMVKIVAGQAQTTEDEVVEAAIRIIYKLMPDDRNARLPLDAAISRADPDLF